MIGSQLVIMTSFIRLTFPANALFFILCILKNVETSKATAFKVFIEVLRSMTRVHSEFECVFVGTLLTQLFTLFYLGGVVFKIEALIAFNLTQSHNALNLTFK